MERFAWQTARSVAEAATLGRQTVAAAMLADPGQRPVPDCVVMKAGGIDLLDLMKEGLLRPSRVVNLREIPGLDTITDDGGGLRIGALVTLEQLVAHPVLRQRYTALADAAASAASPQIGHAATLGGNLLQRPRCWYFRSAAHRCSRKGGDHCVAFAGENHYHAVFGQFGCAMVHPSTAASALAVFGARVDLVKALGVTRSVPFGDFVVGPNTDITRETDLTAREVLTAVLLPPAPAWSCSVFLKRAERFFDWSVADIAVVLNSAPEGWCQRASVVLGAAAPIPWRAPQAEALLVGQMIDASVAREAGQAAVAGASPLGRNAYKLPILATLVRRAVLQAVGATE